MKRLITGILLASLIFYILFSDLFVIGWLFMLLAGGIGLKEYFTMSLSEAEQPYRTLGICLGITPIVAAYHGSLETTAAAFTLAMVLFFVVLLFSYTDLLGRVADQNILSFMVRFVFGFAYIGLLGAHVILIFKQPQGSHWLILLFLITGMSDSCAYYAGRAFGKHKLCPQISPGKTVQGFIGGLIGAVLATVLLGHYLFPATPAWAIGLIAGLTTCLGVVGDLIESVIKRSVKVKDSGSILPGHGGLLDRMDSLLISAPSYYYLVFLLLPAILQ